MLQVELNRRRLGGLDDLRDQLRRLAAISTDLPVIFDIGSETLLGDVVRAYDDALGAGFAKVHFAARTTL
jgi:hypothetical protein